MPSQITMNAQLPMGDNDFSLAIAPGIEKESMLKNERLEKLFFTVNTMLGGTSVRVELFDDDYRIAFQRSLDMFRAMSSRSIYETYGFLSAVANVQTYKLHEAIDNVIQIYRKRSLFGSAGTGFDYFAQVAASLIYPGSQPGGFLGIASYDFALQYEETLNRLFARDIQFTYRPEVQMLYITQNPKGPEMIVLRCSVLKTIEELLTDHWARNWLTGYTAAMARIILGEKRGKFSGGLPGAQGSTQLNGDRLIERGEKEIETLQQQILDFQDGGAPAYPIMG